MAKKSRNPLEDPPTASSSDEDEVNSSAGEEEEEDSSSSEEVSKNPVKAPSDAVTIAVPGKTTASSAAAAAKQAANSDSGSETETDSDSETERPTNPGSEKAVTVAVASAAASAAKPKKKEAALALPAVKPSTKRPNEGTSRDTNTKRAKKVTSGDEEKKIGEDTKKPAFQRLWSEEDEISLLQGMIDFKADNGKSPYEDTNGFFKFIKKSISFEVSKNQFMDKIRSLKKKYMSKGKNGLEPNFTKAHDQKCYELSKFIWGPEGIALESVVKSNGVSRKSQKSKKIDSVKQELCFGSPNGKSKKVEDEIHGGDVEETSVVDVMKSDWFENSFLVRSIAGFGVDEDYVKQRWSFVSVEMKKKIEEKLKVLQGKELEFVVEKTEFLNNVTSVINEASSKNKSLDL